MVSIQTKREQMRLRSREETECILKLAGFEIRHTWELANGYWPDAPDYDDVRTPWWLFWTEIGPIRIGRRKRVIEIDWRACEVRCEVTKDNVTKENYLVHAWTPEKAVEYMRALREQHK
jgi:hypothetical protein